MKHLKVVFIIIIMLFLTTCYCWSFSAKPKGKITPGSSKGSGGYKTPDRVKVKHTKVPPAGYSNSSAVEDKSLNPLQIKYTPTPSSKKESVSTEPHKQKRSNILYIIAGVAVVVLALVVGGLFYYQSRKKSVEF